LILSSAFAVIGVALFASWSILSNITAGVILFFSFPFKIGDHIRIFDKELEGVNEFWIEDIKAYHVHLRTPSGELVTYPNNLFLQKAVTLLEPEVVDSEGSDAL
jgi:small-conductance mechanosensitive channel